MNDERIEGAFRAFHDRLVAGDEIKNVNAPISHAARVMHDAVREPVATCFDEFGLMESRALLPPTGTFANWRDAIDQVPRRIMLVAVPTDIGHTARDVDRPRPAVETKSLPIPKLEGEDEGGRADLQHHGVGPRTM